MYFQEFVENQNLYSVTGVSMILKRNNCYKLGVVLNVNIQLKC